jgi:hypothetical protein
MWARIENGAVLEITNIDPAGRFHPSMRWLKADSQVITGWMHDGAKYSAPLPNLNGLLAQLTAARKEQEQQGVTVNGIRYAGDPGNRQALQEAISFMDDAGLTEFPKWKDSDGQFHVDHPMSDVLEAYRAIGARRASLIKAEGQYAEQIAAGTLTDLSEVVWP